jgi:hypothetical protein
LAPTPVPTMTAVGVARPAGTIIITAIMLRVFSYIQA